MNLIKRGAIVCALMLGATIADAAGLGKLTVHSSLGQILNAEIDLVSLQPGELDAINARVAPPEAYRDARIEYVASLRLLRFSVDKRANGQPIIKVTSVAPINEPFVDMLIEVSWPAGRIQREYPILLDPPGYANRAPVPPTVSAAPAAPSRPAETPPASAPAASSSAPDPSAGAPATPATTPSTGAPSARTELASTPPGSAGSQSGSDTYGPVERGDTLNKIASQVKPQDVSLEQMLVALYRENQAAFVNNNMNRLKTGQILKVPSAEEVQKIAVKEANTEYRTHVADWRAYRDQLAGGVATIPARSEQTNVAAGSVGSAAVTPPAAPAAEPKDVLKLSKSDAAAGKAGAGSAKGGGATQERLNALQEELTAKNKALQESQSRVADLEKQIRDMQRLMDLKTGAPVKADPKVAAAPPPAPAKVDPAKPAEPPKVAATTPAPAPAKVEPAKPAEPPKADAPKPAEPPKADTKVAQAPKPTPPKADAKTPAKKAAAAPPPEKGIVDELMDNPAWLMGGLGLLAAIGIGGFLFMRRRKSGAEAGQNSSLTSAFPSDLKPGSATGKPAGGLVDTGNSSFLTDFDKSGPGTIDTDEVDPVAEAEVYIAYGRDAQAEEILKEAMARDRGRHEIALKLLEIYHSRKSATAFETVAKELRSAVGEDSPMWQKAAAMGAQIDPTNPLYAAGAGAAGSYTAAAPAARPDVDFGIDSASSSQPAPDFDLDVDPTRSKAPESTGSQASMSSGLDFDMNASAPAPAPAAAEAPKEDKPSFDFDLSGLDLGTKSDSGSLETTNTPAPMADLSLDMDSGGGGGGGSEAVGTKLELAKAYLEIGDKDGARDILQEVAKEGSADQRAEAERLISSL